MWNCRCCQQRRPYCVHCINSLNLFRRRIGQRHWNGRSCVIDEYINSSPELDSFCNGTGRVRRVAHICDERFDAMLSGRPNAPLGSSWSAREYLIFLGRIPRGLDTPGAGHRAHQTDSGAGSGARAVLCRLPATAPPRGAGSPGPCRDPPDSGDRAGVSALGGVRNMLAGWALAMQGQSAAGLTQLRQGLAAVAATGQALSQPFGRILLAEAVGTPVRSRKGYACSRRPAQRSRPVGGVTCWRRHTGSRGNFSCAKQSRMQPTRKPVSSRP